MSSVSPQLLTPEGKTQKKNRIEIRRFVAEGNKQVISSRLILITTQGGISLVFVHDFIK